MAWGDTHGQAYARRFFDTILDGINQAEYGITINLEVAGTQRQADLITGGMLTAAEWLWAECARELT